MLSARPFVTPRRHSAGARRAPLLAPASVAAVGAVSFGLRPHARRRSKTGPRSRPWAVASWRTIALSAPTSLRQQTLRSERTLLHDFEIVRHGFFADFKRIRLALRAP